MVLNLIPMILLLPFQQVLNIYMFVTIIRSFLLARMVIHTFESIRVNNFFTR